VCLWWVVIDFCWLVLGVCVCVVGVRGGGGGWSGVCVGCVGGVGGGGGGGVFEGRVWCGVSVRLFKHNTFYSPSSPPFSHTHPPHPLLVSVDNW